MKTITRVFWLFGRSGAGKTTLAVRLCGGLKDLSIPVIHLDGDDLRPTLCSDLQFSPKDRLENHRRIAEVARLLARQGFNIVVSTMAPEQQQRDLVTQILGKHLVWIYIDASLDLCMRRDPKGLYSRAAQGQVKGLIDYPFDPPREKERRIFIDTAIQNVEQCYHDILEEVKKELTDFAI